MKRKIGIAAAIILALFVVTGCQKQEETPKKSEQKKTEASEELLSGTHHAEIQVKDYGTITVELDADTAPITVTNFVNLAKDGFYDNLTFHRIMDGFMIQGGDPNGDGTGGADQLPAATRSAAAPSASAWVRCSRYPGGSWARPRQTGRRRGWTSSTPSASRPPRWPSATAR